MPAAACDTFQGTLARLPFHTHIRHATSFSALPEAFAYPGLDCSCCKHRAFFLLCPPVPFCIHTTPCRHHHAPPSTLCQHGCWAWPLLPSMALYPFAHHAGLRHATFACLPHATPYAPPSPRCLPPAFLARAGSRASGHGCFTPLAAAPTDPTPALPPHQHALPCPALPPTHAFIRTFCLPSLLPCTCLPAWILHGKEESAARAAPLPLHGPTTPLPCATPHRAPHTTPLMPPTANLLPMPAACPHTLAFPYMPIPHPATPHTWDRHHCTTTHPSLPATLPALHYLSSLCDDSPYTKRLSQSSAYRHYMCPSHQLFMTRSIVPRTRAPSRG